MKTVKIGDSIMYRPRYGRGDPVCAEVVGLELTREPHQFHGEPILKADPEQIEDNLVIFILLGNKWAYSDQVDGLAEPDVVIDVTHPKVEAGVKDDLVCEIAGVEKE